METRTTVQVGDEVVAIGNPFGLDRTVTKGIVSALQRQITAPNGFTIDEAIQTDAAINHGNSGGPLINTQGEVIGVNSQIETGGVSEGNVGVGFAVPVNTVKDVAAQLIDTGKVERAFLGIEMEPITRTLPRPSTYRSTRAFSSPLFARAARPMPQGSRAATRRSSSTARPTRSEAT